MKKGIVLAIILLLISSAFVSFSVPAESTLSVKKEESSTIPVEREPVSEAQPLGGDPQLQIVHPEEGNLYLFNLQPIKAPFATAFGYAMVIGRSFNIDTLSTDIHHAKFVAQRAFAGWSTSAWDYNTIDGVSQDLGLKTGIYDITVTGYDEGDIELVSDSVRVVFLQVGGDNFGIWVNTRFDNGETYTTPLNIGLAEFGSMLNTGETKQFQVTLQEEDDTTVEMRFTRTKIMGDTIKVIQTNFNVDTACDTTKDYEASLEFRFPFVILDGGNPSDFNNPYFSAKVGYHSHSEQGQAPNQVNTTFYFGREQIDDPLVFRLKLLPNNLGSDSQITYYNSYRTVDSDGQELFYREFSTEFDPATELTITTIPSELKIQYDFGESAGVATKVTFRAEGGLLDDISQSFNIDPLPSYMAFDLTILGVREFIYESDSTYDVTYSLDSEEEGNLVTFEVEKVPETIHAYWGIDLGEFADLNVSSYAELDMSQEVDRLALYFHGNEVPFIELDHFPRQLRFGSYIDVLSGKGNVTIHRDLQEDRIMNITGRLDEFTVTKMLELKNNYVQFSWDINLIDGQGNIEIIRDSESTISLSTIITYYDWTFTKTTELKNNYVQLAWDVNREERRGNIIFQRDESGGDPSVTFSIAHDTWAIADTLEFKNHYIELYWDLPDDVDHHAEIGLYTGGDEIFYNTISVLDDGLALLSFGIGLKTEDHFFVSWDNIGGVISNFEWSGRILGISSLDLSMNLPGDLFTIAGSWQIGESGGISLAINKEVTVNFVDIQTNRFDVNGYISFDANRQLDVQWRFIEGTTSTNGFVRVSTNGDPLGEEASFQILFDPQNQANYKYGVMLIAPDFLEANFNVSWYTGGTFPIILIAGDLPGNWQNWEKWLLWNYEWHEIGG